MTVYNINDRVTFQLTEYGERVLKAHDQSAFYQKDTNNNYEMQIWIMMQIFGDKMYMGNHKIFVRNRLDIKGEFDKAFEMLEKLYLDGNISFELERSRHACGCGCECGGE